MRIIGLSVGKPFGLLWYGPGQVWEGKRGAAAWKT
jgi:hypothetical protein